MTQPSRATEAARPRAYSYIRMSTPEQLKGDSKRRQLELSAEFAAEHDLQMVEEDQLEDLAVSAFRGANVNDGALGQFLAAAESGKIAKGSYLLVESLDRLSRQPILKSQALFLRIINAGIKLVTLDNDRIYSDESQLGDWIQMLLDANTANQESEKKSGRVAKAWANKRANASTKPLTKQCPAWLELSDDGSHFIIIKPRKKIVLSMFEDSAAGIGLYRIARRLNKTVPAWNGKSWHQSYVARILANRAVLGEFQPHKRVGKNKRVAVGEPIKGYYPRIMDEELFYRAHHGKQQRRIHGRGRKGENFSNLFSGVVIKCTYCGGRMLRVNKGAKDGRFFSCEAARRGAGCDTTTSWRYDQFEKSFIALVDQLDLLSIIRDDDSEMTTLSDEITALQGEVTSLSEEMERCYQMNSDHPSQFISKKIFDLEQRQIEKQQVLEQKLGERQQRQGHVGARKRSSGEMKALIARAQTQGSHDLEKLRSRLNANIKTLVSAIRIAPVGTKGMDYAGTPDDDDVAAAQTGDDRFFTVDFKDGNRFWAWPNNDDPTVLDNFQEQD